MNDPVAWIKQGRLGYPVLEFDKPFRYESYAIQNPPIPLYTHQYERPHNTVLVPCDKLAEMQAKLALLKAHPVKEQLTNEKIEECCCFLDVGLHHRYKPNKVVKDIDWTVTGIKDFVEAILRKASEK